MTLVTSILLSLTLIFLAIGAIITGRRITLANIRIERLEQIIRDTRR